MSESFAEEQVEGQVKEGRGGVEVGKEEGGKEESYVDSSFAAEHFIEPAIEIPSKRYSLEPDMANGWKPKKKKATAFNVFSLNYVDRLTDELVWELTRKRHPQTLVYLGPRKANSYVLHQHQLYANPYPPSKRIEPIGPTRPHLPNHLKLPSATLAFDSDFESGNLDAAIQVSEREYDLLMRVDTNSRGHTNWYYFSVRNEEHVGTFTFKICNFRREKSLYQRGLKPYVKCQAHDWQQSGTNVHYNKEKLRYGFLYEEQGQESVEAPLYALTFDYHFSTPHDTVFFAYSVPYTYSTLLKYLKTLEHAVLLAPLKSLCGLEMPVLEVTDAEEPEESKKVVVVTARVHPGEANSSLVAEGLLDALCEARGAGLRKAYIFYVVPMLNPDGVVAGNYRTSLFGKDLNRTFSAARKYAFPQTHGLLEWARQLKLRHGHRWTLYLDLHGHSVKKSAFMYGPEYSLQHAHYDCCRELPRLLAGLTSIFRYHGCIFRISDAKAATGRAIFNRLLDIPFTYTLESSNGFFFDSHTHSELPFTSAHWRLLGAHLAQALHLASLTPLLPRTHSHPIAPLPHPITPLPHPITPSPHPISHSIPRPPSPPINPVSSLLAPVLHTIPPHPHSNPFAYNPLPNQPQNNQETLISAIDRLQQQRQAKRDYDSDDDISEGKSDSEPDTHDLTDKQFKELEEMVEGKRRSDQKLEADFQSQRGFSLKHSSKNITKEKMINKNCLLPPINCLQRAQIVKRKRQFKGECYEKRDIRIKNIQIDLCEQSSPKKRLAVSQMVVDLRTEISKDQFKRKEMHKELISKDERRLRILGGKNYSRQQILFKLKLFKQ